MERVIDMNKRRKGSIVRSMWVVVGPIPLLPILITVTFIGNRKLLNCIKLNLERDNKRRLAIIIISLLQFNNQRTIGGEPSGLRSCHSNDDDDEGDDGEHIVSLSSIASNPFIGSYTDLHLFLSSSACISKPLFFFCVSSCLPSQASSKGVSN